jgi:cytochrome P450
VPLPGRQHAWLVARYDDAAAALKDERLVKNRLSALTPEQAATQPWTPGFFKPLTRNMLDLDAPDHTRLRALVHKAFTPRLVEQMRSRVESLAGELLDRRPDTMDVVRDYALPIPTAVIAEMIGVPARDRHRFHRWSARIVAANASRWGVVRAIPSVIAFLRFIRRLVRDRKAEPRDDLLGALVRAEEAGDRLDEDELVAMIFLLLVAGYETTVNLIGNGVRALLVHPEQLARLREDPALMRTAVEELLRYDSPLETATERFAREDLEIAGVTIPRGEQVFVALASANRDERQFPEPDTLDLGREPNRHLAFGHGAHFCLGAPLARLEGQIAIELLISRHPRLELAVAPESLRWRRGLVLRGLAALPIRTSGR